MQVAFIYGKPLSSELTLFFTGSSCYHVGFTDGVKFWDMNLLRRRRKWPYYPAHRVILVNTPVPVSAAFLEEQLETDNSRYGVVDYVTFAWRWLANVLKVSTGNARGLICSEQVLLDLKLCGWAPPEWMPKVPSPADLERALLGRVNAIDAKASLETARGPS